MALSAQVPSRTKSKTDSCLQSIENRVHDLEPPDYNSLNSADPKSRSAASQSRLDALQFLDSLPLLHDHKEDLDFMVADAEHFDDHWPGSFEPEEPALSPE